MSAANLTSTVTDILRAFCGDDTGRSVAFRGTRPAIPDISIRGSEPRAAASVMKVPLLMAIYQRARRGELDLARTVPVETFGTTRYVSVLAAFDAGHALSLREVCRLALITSDNPLVVHLQSLVDFAAVNRLLAEIGCGAPCRMAAGFTDPELGPANRVNILTADAAAHLFAVLRSDPTYADLMTGLKNNLRNNRMPALLPDEAAVFHKTGSLDGVANDVGIVQDDKVDFTLAFLTDRQGDPAQTSNDIAACTLRVYEALAKAS
jgi:beta-lactamase class A